MTTPRVMFAVLKVVDGMFLVGGIHPDHSDNVTANEVCTIVDTDTVNCEVVGTKFGLGLSGQKHLSSFSYQNNESLLMTVKLVLTCQLEKMRWPVIYFSSFESTDDAVVQCGTKIG